MVAPGRYRIWRKWSKQDDALLRDLCASGADVKQMVRKLARTERAVYQRMDKLDISRKIPLPPRLIERINTMRADGMTIKVIGEKIGVPYGRVHYVLQKSRKEKV